LGKITEEDKVGKR